MPNKKPLVLCIEDDNMLRSMYKNLFTIHGFAFAGAKDFDEGEKLIRENNPVIILLDLVLPSKAKFITSDLNVGLGLDLLKSIKENPDTKNIPVMILSNVDETEVKKKAENLGACEYLTKADVLPKEVLKRTREILEEHGIEPPCDPRKEKC